MPRRKQAKFAENAMRHNVIQSGKPIYDQIKGNWHSDYFKNDHDIVLELACGRGEYTVGLAEVYPDRNFIGIDVKGDRIWKGSGDALEKGLDNVAFLRTSILELGDFFAENEVAEIWIVHPDPKPRKGDGKRRLTHPRFLNIYKNIIKPDGIVRLKTDNTPFFDYTLEVLETAAIKELESTFDLYNSPLLAEHHGIKTRFELKFTEEGYDIKYLKFKFI